MDARSGSECHSGRFENIEDPGKRQSPASSCFDWNFGNANKITQPDNFSCFEIDARYKIHSVPSLNIPCFHFSLQCAFPQKHIYVLDARLELGIYGVKVGVFDPEILCQIKKVFLGISQFRFDTFPHSQVHEFLYDLVFTEGQIFQRYFFRRYIRENIHPFIAFGRHCCDTEARSLPNCVNGPAFIPFDVRHYSSDKYLISSGDRTELKQAAQATFEYNKVCSAIA
nr:MAG TPA: hypothetical protein [Caudoviricetes sp.]